MQVKTRCRTHVIQILYPIYWHLVGHVAHGHRVVALHGEAVGAEACLEAIVQACDSHRTEVQDTRGESRDSGDDREGQRKIEMICDDVVVNHVVELIEIGGADTNLSAGRVLCRSIPPLGFLAMANGEWRMGDRRKQQSYCAVPYQSLINLRIFEKLA